MQVRRLLHSLGYRYRLHAKDLPGKPDLVFRRQRLAVFVHGCFWHRHQDPCCKLARLPKSRIEFWGEKLERNRLRDIKNEEALVRLGWRVLTIWECQVGDAKGLESVIRASLGT